MRLAGRTTYGAWGMYPKEMARLRVMDRFNDEPIAKQRLKIIEFSNHWGICAAADAYGLHKVTIKRWRKKYEESHNDPNSLIPLSRRPHHLRSCDTPYQVIEKIREIRYSNGTLGAGKIKPLLDEFCDTNQYKCISESTIKRIIKRRKMRKKSHGFTHTPGSRRGKRIKPKTRIKYAPNPQHTGYIEADTITRRPDGSPSTMYIFNAIDVCSRYMYAHAYTSKSSINGKDFLQRLVKAMPFEITLLQTDNGTEFLGEMEKEFNRMNKQERKDNPIDRLYILPHSPRINGRVERANRSLQEEFVYHKENIRELKGIEAFNEELDKYLIWYNTRRVHDGLGGITPAQFLELKKGK